MKQSKLIIIALVLITAVLLCLGCKGEPPLEPTATAAPQMTTPAPAASEIIRPVTAPPTPSPTSEPTATPTQEPTPFCFTASLGFVGDVTIMPGNLNAAKYQDSYDFAECFAAVKDVFESVDVMGVNMEGTLAGEEHPYSCTPKPGPSQYYRFNAPDVLAQNMSDCGVNLATVANNHCLDFKAEGLFRTIDVLNEHNIATVGGAKSPQDFEKPLIMDVNGISFGFVGATIVINKTAELPVEYESFALTKIGIDNSNYDAPENSLEQSYDMVREQIEDCKNAGAEFIVILVHWGWEYRQYSNEIQHDCADKLISFGADAIIGAHSHCPQPFEWRHAKRDGKDIAVPVVYSLGNFIANMGGDHDCDVGVFSRLIVEKTQDGVRCTNFGCLPLFIARVARTDRPGKMFQTQPVFMNEGEPFGCLLPIKSVRLGLIRAYNVVNNVCVANNPNIELLTYDDFYPATDDNG